MVPTKNNDKKGRDFMKKILAMFMAVSMGMSAVCSVRAESIFPDITTYSDGIDGLDDTLLSEQTYREVISGGFETHEEISEIADNNYSDSRKIVENSHSGKFALQIQQKTDDILPIVETDYFRIADVVEEADEIETYSETEDGITITMVDKIVEVSGQADPETEITLYVNNSEGVEHREEILSEEDGTFYFEYEVDSYGEYTINVERTGYDMYTTEVLFTDPASSEKTEKVAEKTNLISMKIKPMSKAKTISFYVKAKVKTDSGIIEEYVLIKSDKNGDGIFEVGEDLSLGKWQDIELALDTVEEDLVNQSVSGLYMKANSNSSWIFDELGSDYRNVNCTELDLQQSAKGNVVYDSGLRFSKAIDGTFNTEGTIVTTGIDVEEEIHSIDVESYIQNNGQIEEAETEVSELLLEADFSAEKWTVNSTDYESATSGVSTVVEDGILFKPDGCAEFDAGSFSTNDRVKIELDLKYSSGSCATAQKLDIELYENGDQSPYYTSNGKIASSDTSSITYILPKIRENTVFKLTYKNDSNTTESKISKFSIYSITEEDWNSNVLYKYGSKEQYMNFSETSKLTKKSVTELPNYIGNEYAVRNKNARGAVCVEDTSISITCSTSNKLAIKVINLNNSDRTITVGSATYKIPFGETDIITNAKTTITVSADENILLVSLCEYSSDSGNRENTYFKAIEGMGSNTAISKDGSKVYFDNYYDDGAVYVYDISNKESKRICDAVDDIICLSDDGKYMVYELDGEHYLCAISSGEEDVLLPTGEKYSFNAHGELFYIAENEDGDNEVNMYLNGSTEVLMEGNSYAFDNSGKYIIVESSYKNSTNSTVVVYTLYKNYNGSYTEVKSVEPGKKYSKLYLNDDLSVFYSSDGSVIDLHTGEQKESIGSIRYKASDNTFIVGNIKLYNPSTGESYKITDATGDVVHYNPDTCMLTIINDGYIARYKFTSEKSSAKYLLSFDGENTWQSYKNGRWITVSSGRTPTETEIGAQGMTGDELNNITPAAYKKLYTNGTDILSVNVAIYMNSNSNKLTPVISKMTVNTSEGIKSQKVFSIRNKEFIKSDYANVTSIFPVEDFKADAECYYLLYLGNEWLYTYKDNKLIKIEETADELLGDVDNSWLKFKQYAMSTRELCNIPADVLTNLFVNPEYANTEFGVIYVLKGENTIANTVTFKVQANAKHITSDEVVIEVKMNGGDIKVVDSRDFDTKSIENFLAWLENRQSGKGEIFYIFKNDEVQFFINYYMIDSINLYDAENYATEDTDEQMVVVSE